MSEMQARSPGSGDRRNWTARALWQKWVVQLKEAEDTVGTCYDIRLQGGK